MVNCRHGACECLVRRKAESRIPSTDRMPHAGPNSISPAQLARLLATPDAPLILDVRLAEDAAKDPRVIPTARRVAHAEVAAAMGQKVVVVCQRCKKLSEGAAALLRCQGAVAEVLEGGHAAWAEAGLLALSVGLSRQYRDDLDQLEAAMPLYDALYRWARDGFDDGHDWPAGRAP